jgi:hypothetical protein
MAEDAHKNIEKLLAKWQTGIGIGESKIKINKNTSICGCD